MKMRMTKVFGKGMSVLAATVLALGMIQAGKVHADPSASLSKNGSAEVGKTISINVKVSGDGPYGGYSGKLSYEGDYFELVDIGSGNYGAANFSKNGASFLDYNCNIPSGSTIVVAKLKCKKEGTAKVSVSLNVSSQDGTADYSTGSSAEISISAPVQLSGNNYLSSLSVAPGSLSPSFSKSTTNYHVTVSETQTSIAVSAKAEHGKAKVSLNGVQKDLQMGDNTVKVTVTAENGDKRTYNINVTRGVPTPTPEPYPVIVTDGNSYTILEKESLETIPSGFTWSETTYNTKTVPCLVGPDGTLMMWLLSDSGNGLYIYDLDTQTVAPCRAYVSDSETMLIIPFPSDFKAPSGYEKSTVTYNENEIEVYKNPQAEEFPLIVYMLDKDGKAGAYYFDLSSQMIMPFRGDLAALVATPTPVPTETPTPTPTPTSTPTPTPSPTPAAKDSNSGFKTATILLGILSAALLAGVIFLIVMRQKDRNDPTGPDDPENTESEENTPDEKKSNENEGDYYYQFGDEDPQPRRPGAKRAGESDEPKEEPVDTDEKKEEPLPDFPEFPEKKPEPVIEEPVIPTPLITVVDSDTDKGSSDEKKDDSSGTEDKQEPDEDVADEASEDDSSDESSEDSGDSDASEDTEDKEDDGEI